MHGGVLLAFQLRRRGWLGCTQQAVRATTTLRELGCLSLFFVVSSVSRVRVTAHRQIASSEFCDGVIIQGRKSECRPID